MTVSCANMFGLILVRYSKPIHSIGSGLERWDLRRRIEPVSRPNCKEKYMFYKDFCCIKIDLVQNYEVTGCNVCFDSSYIPACQSYVCPKPVIH